MLSNRKQKQQQSIQEYNNKQNMDLQKSKKRGRPSQKQQNVQQKSKKDLLRLERDIFALKKSQEKQSQYVIRKLMEKKQKPEISMMIESPLLSKLKEFIPILHKSNQQLHQRPIQQSQQIDLKLQQCESSSSSQSESDNDENNLMQQIDEQHQLEQSNELQNEEVQEITNNETKQVKNRLNQMDIEVKSSTFNKNTLIKKNQHKHKSISMEEQSHTSNNYQKNNNNNNNTNINTESIPNNDNLVQINFLTYPYLNQQQIDQLNQNKQPQTNHIQEHIAQLRKKQQQKILVQEINSSQHNAEMKH